MKVIKLKNESIEEALELVATLNEGDIVSLHKDLSRDYFLRIHKAVEGRDILINSIHEFIPAFTLTDDMIVTGKDNMLTDEDIAAIDAEIASTSEKVNYICKSDSCTNLRMTGSLMDGALPISEYCKAHRYLEDTVVSYTSKDALADSIAYAESVGVPEEKILRTDVDIDTFFNEPTTEGPTMDDVINKFNSDQAVKGNPTMSTKQSTKESIKTKGESIMTNTKEKVSNLVTNIKDKAQSIKPTKEEKQVNKKADKKDKFSFKKAPSRVWSFIKKQSTNVLIGAASVLFGGAVTASCGGAMLVGGILSTAIILARTLIKKKKEESVKIKDLLISSVTALSTAAVLPLVLLGLAYAGLIVTTYAFILPYAIIVA